MTKPTSPSWTQQRRLTRDEFEAFRAEKTERREDIRSAMLSQLDQALFRVNEVTGKRELIIELVQ